MPFLRCISFTASRNIIKPMSNGIIDSGSTSRISNSPQCGTTPAPHESTHDLSNGTRGGASEPTLSSS